jgi:hypothetical protein
MSEQISINELVKEVLDYAAANYGAKGGPDFPAISKALSQSETFKSFVKGQALVWMFALTLTRPPANADLAVADKWLDGLPVGEALHMAFYMGMKYGEKLAEVKSLERMAGSE